MQTEVHKTFSNHKILSHGNHRKGNSRLGKSTYRQLGLKYDVDFRIIHSWVMKFQGREKSKKKSANDTSQKTVTNQAEVLIVLTEALRKEKLRNELLNTIIDIAEKDLQINIRKKFGTKQ